MTLEAKQLSFSIYDERILHEVSIQIKEKQLVGLIGPNGSGKSTLLKNMYRLLKPESGTVLLNEQDILKQSSKSIAKNLAVVSQETPVLFDFTVHDLVSMGRTPHKKLLELDQEQDFRIVADALLQTGISHLEKRSFSSLSGGEKKRVMVARALAQQAKVLILDEPTNHLDIQHQLQLMDLIQTLHLTVVAALHDLNIAAMYCDQIYVLQNGRIVCHGTPEEVLTPTLLREVFHVFADIQIHPLTGKPYLTYVPEQFAKKVNQS
ncbi:heme ABC transporter ATP-binding protein [Lysinibacillus irui]|uniref:Heme ABC transporter ATP-binding protein n=1 Tax=Lysinibacillus irui TaxID=2998077 RepID=A0AAJ5RHV7_9BACI|nr:heme ABC transporter ATP-binding protein [Lysinibacillus irui]MEA0555836.1 heme ABC transporter ATP-binding protein [Lysinibacillus irui]MEA0566182.1 heme ABC transporter ATP-binding protein [Lysinibacillus irui]MEA0976936.1 heme ABC transporter ATP-binding protein [Lysinibacillus irui]MEA1043090.1 heme ABC transporter ATP-binding protein [Lysinibacillus irui]WDV06452.1 heme ABC transporter ATP-binding protein [Lysinibacillus irui]